MVCSRQKTARRSWASPTGQLSYRVRCSSISGFLLARLLASTRFLPLSGQQTSFGCRLSRYWLRSAVAPVHSAAVSQRFVHDHGQRWWGYFCWHRFMSTLDPRDDRLFFWQPRQRRSLARFLDAARHLRDARSTGRSGGCRTRRRHCRSVVNARRSQRHSGRLFARRWLGTKRRLSDQKSIYSIFRQSISELQLPTSPSWRDTVSVSTFVQYKMVISAVLKFPHFMYNTSYCFPHYSLHVSMKIKCFFFLISLWITMRVMRLSHNTDHLVKKTSWLSEK